MEALHLVELEGDHHVQLVRLLLFLLLDQLQVVFHLLAVLPDRFLLRGD